MDDGQQSDRSMMRALVELAMRPSEVTYRALHALVTTAPAYVPYSDDLKTLNSLYAAQRYEDVLEKLQGMMPNWMLSPSVHQIAFLASKHLGNEQSARMEFQLAEACLRGLLASGDGSRERPYPVTHIADEYDVIRHLEKSVRQQHLINQDGAQLDCIECEDGSTIWFDVAPLLTRT